MERLRAAARVLTGGDDAAASPPCLQDFPLGRGGRRGLCHGTVSLSECPITAAAKTLSDIRQVPFLNFSYGILVYE